MALLVTSGRRHLPHGIYSVCSSMPTRVKGPNSSLRGDFNRMCHKRQNAVLIQYAKRSMGNGIRNFDLYSLLHVAHFRSPIICFVWLVSSSLIFFFTLKDAFEKPSTHSLISSFPTL